VALKLTNLASIDHSIPQRGMTNVSKLDRAVWFRFFQRLSETGSRLPDGQTVETVENAFADPDQSNYALPLGSGTDILQISSVRQGQQFFRTMVMANYERKCAITGIYQPELLVAGHIRLWASDRENRMNPRNGICLNRLHGKAFEDSLITIEDDGKILYSKRLNMDKIDKMRNMNDSGYFQFPRKFRPEPAFLAEHRSEFLD
jgi:predicted restriction endonuclease